MLEKRYVLLHGSRYLYLGPNHNVLARNIRSRSWSNFGGSCSTYFVLTKTGLNEFYTSIFTGVLRICRWEKLPASALSRLRIWDTQKNPSKYSTQQDRRTTDTQWEFSFKCPKYFDHAEVLRTKNIMVKSKMRQRISSQR